MRAYTDLAAWWPLFSPPSHYVEEATDLVPTLLAAPDAAPATALELGAGGGSLAYHLKHHIAFTLSDLSPGMLANSQAVNPECEHVLGDMRALNLSRTFDLIFIHDAIMYATDEGSLRATLGTAARHCRPGGGIVAEVVATDTHFAWMLGEAPAPEGLTLPQRDVEEATVLRWLRSR